MMRRWPACVTALLLVACSWLGPPPYPLPVGAIAEAPSTSDSLWRFMEACAHRMAPQPAIYVVAGADSVPCSYGTCVGYFDPTRDAIVLAGIWDNVPTRKHEMLHALGVCWHDDPVFARCGAVVVQGFDSACAGRDPWTADG